MTPPRKFRFFDGGRQDAVFEQGAGRVPLDAADAENIH